MPLAPPFTRENAAENARKAVASREVNRLARSITLEQAQKRPHIEPELHRIVKAMSRLPVTCDDYKALSSILSDLWNKAFPTQGAVKASRSPRQAMPEPIATPQEPVAIIAKNDAKIKDLLENPESYSPPANPV